VSYSQWSISSLKSRWVDLRAEFKILFLPSLEESCVFDMKHTLNYLPERFCSSRCIIKTSHVEAFLSEEIEVKKAKQSYWPALPQIRKQHNCKFRKTVLIVLENYPLKAAGLPSSEVSQLISHLAQRFAGSQNLSALFACTQFSCFSSFVKDLPYCLLTSIP